MTFKENKYEELIPFPKEGILTKGEYSQRAVSVGSALCVLLCVFIFLSARDALKKPKTRTLVAMLMMPSVSSPVVSTFHL